LTYSTYVTALATMTAISPTDADFLNILPDCIDYAELRIQRDLNFLNTTAQDTSVTTVAGTRTITIPSTFVVTNAISVFSPAGSDATTGTRVSLIPTSREALDILWPTAAAAGRGTPEVMALVDQFTAVFGPCPDAGYLCEITGTTRFDPISDSNPTNFISTYLPDLLLAASMVFMSSYMRNFSASGNDPQMSVNWESQYQALKASAETEEARKRYWAASWTAFPTSPQAQPQRG
jgi:hypothetical protein